MTDALPGDFPPLLWTHICEADQENGERCQELAQQIVYWADGRHPDELGQVLDAIRGRRAYGVSLELLEAAWNSSAPEGFRAQIAQDWMGTVLFGIGDIEGANTVAQHIYKTSRDMSAGFLSDFADMLMEWGLLRSAELILTDLSTKLPGDLSVKYNLGTCHKFNGQWVLAKAAFEGVSQHHKEALPVLHNLLLTAIATQDTQLTSQMTERIQKVHPETAWHIGKLIQVEIAANERQAAEVLYAVRVAPHLVRLRGIPENRSSLEYDDLVLVDYQAQQYAAEDNSLAPNHLYPILKRIEKSSYETRVFTMNSSEEAEDAYRSLLTHDIPVRWQASSKRLLVALNAENEGTVMADLSKCSTSSKPVT